jgi:hypothetical protein
MKLKSFLIILFFQFGHEMSFGFESLPNAITSFGAVKVDNHIYVHGGHTGDAHVYSKDNHSDKFIRINLKYPDRWEELPINKPMQGFGMTAYDGKIYFSGGSQANNSKEEKSNLSSLDDFLVFNPAENTWSELPSLPSPRSSHQMVNKDGILYVIGGWNMQDGKGVGWHSNGLYVNLKKTPLSWKKLPETKWAVRANSAAIVNDKLFVVGGLDRNGTTNAVRGLDLKTFEWKQFPDLPSSNMMKGFGSVACNLDESLVVGSFSYHPKIFVESNSTWVSSKSKIRDKRFFHRILSLEKGKILLLGGSNWENHLKSCEIIDLSHDLKKIRKEQLYQSSLHSWTGFRGNGNSSSVCTNLPTVWSDSKNIKWRSKIDGYGQSTPVIMNNMVFSTCTIGEESQKLVVNCHSLENGKILWKKVISSPKYIKRSQYVSQAAPSPIIDNKNIYCFFECGYLVAFGHNGKKRWERNIPKEYGPFEGNHGVGSSLFQSGNALGLLIDHAGPSYLLKLNKKTGKNIWKMDRPKRVSWTTPTVLKTDITEKLLLSSNGVVQCINFKNADIVWSWDNIEGNTVASPSFNNDIVVIGSSQPDSTVALSIDEKKNDRRLRWVAEDTTTSFASPLLTEKFLYVVNRAGVVTCHDINDGRKMWNLRLPGSCWASPISTADNIYFFTKDGHTVILENNGLQSVISQNSISVEGRVYGVAPVQDNFILRTGSELICISN